MPVIGVILVTGIFAARKGIRQLVQQNHHNHFRLMALGLLLLVCFGNAAAEKVFELEDPRGDDNGDGNLIYPMNRNFEQGDLDIVKFSARNEKDATVFEVEFANKIRQPIRGAADELGTDMTSIAQHGFYTFNVDIYIDVDRIPESGYRRLMPGRLAETQIDNPWEYAVVLTPRPVVAKRDLRGILEDELSQNLIDSGQSYDNEAIDAEVSRARQLAARHVFFPTQIRVRGRKITFEVPHTFLGEPADADWSYVVAVTAADLSNSMDLGASIGLSEDIRKNLAALPVSPASWQARVGGGRKGEALQPPIMDIIVPEGQNQNWVLSDFQSSANMPAHLPGVVPSGKYQSSPATDGWQNAHLQGQVYYEIFVRSFADSDGDGIGDFNGLIEKLDYLNDGDPATETDLQVDGLWLMPIMASPSYHGYDCTDYFKVNPDYGTEEDFERLVAEAHKRGINIVLDLMLNHSSNQHPWFQEACDSPESPLRHWYVWREDDPGWTQPWGGSSSTWHEFGGQYYYGVFWGGMPDLNFENPAVVAEAGKIAQFWLDKGVDGFRLDAARHLIATGPGPLQNDTPETHTVWKQYSKTLREMNPKAMMLGEIWADASSIANYYGETKQVSGGDEFPMTFNFPLAGSILSSVNSGDPSHVTNALDDMSMYYPEGVLDGTFLANHDMMRMATQFDGLKKLQGQAAAILLTLPGTPFLYYGEELGLQNGPTNNDEDKRTPMPWDTSAGGGFTSGTPWHRFAPGRETNNVADENTETASLLNRYRRLIRVRAGNEALKTGRIEIVGIQGTDTVLAYLRTSAQQQVLVIHNLGDTAVTAMWELSLGEDSYRRLYGDRGVGQPVDGALTLPARGTGIWEVR